MSNSKSQTPRKVRPQAMPLFDRSLKPKEKPEPPKEPTRKIRIQKINNKEPEMPKSNSLAIIYFNTHPESFIDDRPPTEKLSECEQLIQRDDIDEDNLQSILMQRKTLCDLKYGEDSVQSITALIDISVFYQKTNRNNSALRHLNTLRETTKVLDLPDTVKLRLAIEIAESNLAAECESEEDRLFHLEIAETSLIPFIDIISSNPVLEYRKNILMIKMKLIRNKKEKALKYYSKAIMSLANMHQQEDKDVADLCIEAAELAREVNLENLAHEFYQHAFEISSNIHDSEQAEYLFQLMQALEKEEVETDED